MASPTARTLTALRAAGYVADPVERFIAAANIRKDLFGCIDLVAVHPLEPGVLGVQATTRGNLASRLAKARARPELRPWLQAGNRFEAWGWEQRAGRWHAVKVTVRAADLSGAGPLPLPRRRRSARQRELFQPDIFVCTEHP